MSAGPALPPTWNLDEPTPSGERIAVATAFSNLVLPTAAIMPPTFTAPVLFSSAVASVK